MSSRSIDPFTDLRLLVAFIREFRSSRPNVVHSFTIKPAIFGTIAAWLTGVPLRVVTITGLGHAFTTAGWTIRTTVKCLYRVALSKAHIVFFQNRDDLELFLQEGLVRTERARLVAGSGVDLEHFSPTALPFQNARAPRFLMIARLLCEKGVREYVEAACLVKSRRDDVSFALLGGIDPRNPSSLSPEELTRLRATCAVEWIDEVADVRPHIAAADVMVLPSYREGLPRTLLEGAAMGRPIVTTDVPGCRDVVIAGQNGYLVPVADSKSLADAILKLCDSPEDIFAFGKASRRLAEERFDQRIVNECCFRAYVGRDNA